MLLLIMIPWSKKTRGVSKSLDQERQEICTRSGRNIQTGAVEKSDPGAVDNSEPGATEKSQVGVVEKSVSGVALPDRRCLSHWSRCCSTAAAGTLMLIRSRSSDSKPFYQTLHFSAGVTSSA